MVKMSSSVATVAEHLRTYGPNSCPPELEPHIDQIVSNCRKFRPRVEGSLTGINVELSPYMQSLLKVRQERSGILERV